MAGYPETSGTLISKGDSSWPVTQYSAVPVWDSLGFQSFLQVSLACTTRMCAMTSPVRTAQWELGLTLLTPSLFLCFLAYLV